MAVSSAAGQALSNIGQGVQQVGQAMNNEAAATTRLLREQEEQDAKAWAGNALSDAQLQWQQTLTERKLQATGGASGFTPQLLGDFDKYSEQTLEAAPTPASKRYLQQHLTALRTQIGGQAVTFEAGARVSERVKNVAGSIDNWSNVVYTDPSQAQVALASIEQTMPEVGPEMRDKLMRTAGETIPYYAASGVLERAGKTGDLVGVRAERARLEGPEGEVMDPAKRSALITRAYGYENGIVASQERAQAKAERDAQAREAAGTEIFNKAFDLNEKGVYFSQDFIAEASTTVTGTTAEAPFRALLKSNMEGARFASMSLPQQQAELERMRAASATPEIGVNPTEQAVYEQRKRINQASMQAYKENPWQAAQERSVISDVPRTPITDIPTAQRAITERMAMIRPVEAAADRKISPLEPEQAQQLGQIIRNLPPEQQASALASIGSTVGDADRVSDLARQMSDKDQTLGVAMAYANSRTSFGRFTSELVLRGERAIRDGVVKIDNARETGWKAEIAKEIGDATQNQRVREQWINAAYLIQAGIAADGGSTDIKQAVNLATGGIITKNGSKIPLPYGTSESAFNDRLNAVKPADLVAQTRDSLVYVGRQPVPLDQFVTQLPRATLVHAGQGKYAVNAGGSLVKTGPGGRPLIIDLSQNPGAANAR
ncbi:hypothetical protein E5S69_11605 [Cupriavidus necator]|uniref:hypothetical protein n=1 Tax=Cupriavidus necator TaxID=106590 RepID=UPI00148F5DE3|nr:hypothetical protein [Cupriavidus necator]NOV24157.1 hypothetical protein [Cupriavidus necator]